jgi:ribonuclease BN (tRNA processing enzyme)
MFSTSAKVIRCFSFSPGATQSWSMAAVPSAIRRHRGETHGPDPGEEAVSTYLWSRGFKQIDVVALTHAHQDHIGGLTAIFDNFKVNTLWIGREVASPQQRQLETLLPHSVHKLFTSCEETISILMARTGISCGRKLFLKKSLHSQKKTIHWFFALNSGKQFSLARRRGEIFRTRHAF